MAQQYHFHFYGGPPGPLHWPFTSGDRDFHSRRREAYKIRIGAPSTPCTIADSKSATQQTGPSCLRACRPSLRNLSGSEAGPGAEGVDTITGDMMKYLTRRPDLCLHQLSPSLRILFRPARPPCRSASAEHMPSQTTPEHWFYDTARFSFSQSGCKS